MIYITDKCNMNCSYCYNKFPRDNKDIDMNLLLKYIDNVYKKTNRDVDILLIGGEPSLYKKVHEFIIQCREKEFIKDIDIFTNFSRDINFYKLLIKNRVNLVCAWHNETDDNNFINKLNSLTNNEKKFIVEIAMMFEHDNMDRWNNIICQILKNYKNVIQPWILYDKYTTKEYTQIQKKEFIKALLKLEKISLSDFKNKNAINTIFNQYCNKYQESFINQTCSAGYDTIYIHNNGDVYKCQNDFFYNLPKLYNINDNNAEFDMGYYKIQKCICNYCRHGNLGVTIQ